MVYCVMMPCQFQRHPTGNKKLHPEKDFETGMRAFFLLHAGRLTAEADIAALITKQWQTQYDNQAESANIME